MSGYYTDFLLKLIFISSLYAYKREMCQNSILYTYIKSFTLPKIYFREEQSGWFLVPIYRIYVSICLLFKNAHFITILRILKLDYPKYTNFDKKKEEGVILVSFRIDILYKT